MGNVVEWYDFAVYGASAAVLAQVLAPGGDGGLTAVFAVFAFAVVARPAGAVLVGWHADRRGRRSALAAMLLTMTMATVGIGLLPPYGTAGAAAAASLLLLRAVQGFASGGELAASIPFLVEHAPPDRRGLWGGLHTGTLAVGLGAGTAAVAAVASVAGPQTVTAWAWRIPFLVALPLGIVGLYIRSRTSETAPFLQLRPSPVEDSRRVLRAHGRDLRDGFVLTATLSSTFNLWFVFLPAHLVTTGRHDLLPALGGSLVGIGVLALAAPLMGMASDRFGRRPLLVSATSLLLLVWAVGYPLATSGSLSGLVVTSAVVGLALAQLVLPAAIAERLPTSVRAVGIGVAVGTASGVVGGTAPLIADLLTRAGAGFVVGAYALAWVVPALVVSARWGADPAHPPVRLSRASRPARAR